MAAKKKKVEVKVRINLRRLMWAGVAGFFVLAFLLSFLQTKIDEGQLELSGLLRDIRDGKVERVEVQEEKLIVKYKDGEIKFSVKEPTISFPELLAEAQIEPDAVEYVVVDQTIVKLVSGVLGVILPIILMGGLLWFLFRSQAKGARDIFSFGKSKAKLFAKGKQDVTFDDVAGVETAKKELEEVVDFLKSPTKYRKIGARTPKGAILFGPAGVGKTLLAKAVAGEAGVPFFSMAGSEFMEMLVGVGASRVRDLFAQAKMAAPSIIFIDEIDAIGRQRGRGIMGGHDEREQTLNQILVEMDGFTPNDNVFVIAATNRGDLLDPALLRPGRFDRRVALDMPDKEGRKAILAIHAKGKKFVDGIDWERVADRTVGFSGADLENMLNEAAILAARDGKNKIEPSDIEEAATKVKLGPVKKKLQSDEDRRITAFHEAGHAVVTHCLSKTDPVQKVSIVARGMSLGHTEIAPSADRSHETKTRILQQITALLGGRVAEEAVFDEMTAGAASDIKIATRYARAMVVELGMSDLGPINFGPDAQYADFGKITSYEDSGISPATREAIDEEVKKIFDVCKKEAAAIIKKNRKKLDEVAEALLSEETLNRDEFEKIVGKKVEYRGG